jgi:hypothetical protein
VESARKGIAMALKMSDPSLGYLASYARIAIHHGKFSPEPYEMAQCTRNKIAQGAPAGLRLLPNWLLRLLNPTQDMDPRVEES